MAKRHSDRDSAGQPAYEILPRLGYEPRFRLPDIIPPRDVVLATFCPATMPPASAEQRICKFFHDGLLYTSNGAELTMLSGSTTSGKAMAVFSASQA